MQNKKILLQHLLLIYITFFLVVAAGIAHGILPGFTRGAAAGFEIGNDMARSWASGTPRTVYLLGNIRVRNQPEHALEIAAPEGTEIRAGIDRLQLIVEEEAPGTSPLLLAFRSIGGSGWLYALVLLIPLFYIAIIVLMCLIIRSLRRSIREERPLARRNVGCLRIMGLLTVLAELTDDVIDWSMNRRAAELLAGSGYTVDTGFHVTYSMILMGVLILFAAEVFAVGQNLSEEQKLTI